MTSMPSFEKFTKMYKDIVWFQKTVQFVQGFSLVFVAGK